MSRCVLVSSLGKSFRFAPRLILFTIAALSIASTARSAGPLKVDPANPRYFTDSRGSIVYLAGTYLTHEQVELGADFTAYLDFLREQKHNFTRLWAWEQTPASAPNPLAVLPYERTGPGRALDGGPKFDLRRFNQVFFDRLRGRVEQAAERGIYVSVVLFQSAGASPRERTHSWIAHPFNRENNINGIDGDPSRSGDGEETYSLKIPEIARLQEDYLRKVIDTLHDLDNVLYEIGGETPAVSKERQDHFIEYIKRHETAKAHQHPVGIGYFYGGTAEYLLASPADWVSLLSSAANPPANAGNKVVVQQMAPALLKKKVPRQWVWKNFMGGYQPIFADSDPSSVSRHATLREAFTDVLSFAQLFDLSSLVPAGDLCPNGYCLANPGFQYLVYFPSGGPVTVDLSTHSRTFAASWLNPISGQTFFAPPVQGGGKITLRPPFSSDAVLYLVAESSASASPSTSDSAPLRASAASPGFSLSAAGALSVTPGLSASATITTTLLLKKTSRVDFSVSGLPPGASGSFSQNFCKPTCATVLTVQTSASTPPGSYPLRVNAAGGGKGNLSVTINLTVAGPEVETAATPTIAPNGGAFTGSTSVTLQSATAGASIYYSTDGTAVSESSSLYTGPMTLSATTLLKAKAFRSGMNPSAEASAWFSKMDQFDFDLAHSGNVSVAAGSSITNTISAGLTSGGGQAVSFSVSGLPADATGSFSSAACSPTCSTVLTISTSDKTPTGSYLLIISATGGGVTRTTSFTLAIATGIALTVATPTVAPNGGDFFGSVAVTLQTATSGASIYYTTDGSLPTESSHLYSGPVTLTNSATVTARAFKSGYQPSATASASFTNTAATYYVATTGSDAHSCAQAKSPATPKRTITAALACVGAAGTDVGAGHTVQVASGIYDERLMNKIPSGTSWSAPFTLKSATPLGAILRPSADGSIIELNQGSHYIVIDGFTIDGQAQTSSGTGIALSAYNWGDIHHIRIVNNEIKNIKNDGITGGHGTYLEVINNSIHDVGGAAPGYAHGFYSVVANSTVEKNKIYNSAGYGLHFYNNYGGAGLVNNIVRYNLIYNVGLATGQAAILASGSNMQIYGNVFHSNANGIWATQGGNNIYIYNNTIYGNATYGILNTSVSGMIVKNNISYLNGSALSAFGTDTIQSNNLLGVNPLFVDPDRANFNLQSGSPAIGQGTCSISAAFASICSAGSCDIGAYQYGGRLILSP